MRAMSGWSAGSAQVARGAEGVSVTTQSVGAAASSRREAATTGQGRSARLLFAELGNGELQRSHPEGTRCDGATGAGYSDQLDVQSIAGADAAHRIGHVHRESSGCHRHAGMRAAVEEEGEAASVVWIGDRGGGLDRAGRVDEDAHEEVRRRRLLHLAEHQQDPLTRRRCLHRLPHDRFEREPDPRRAGEERLERPLRLHLLYHPLFVFNQFVDLERKPWRFLGGYA